MITVPLFVDIILRPKTRVFTLKHLIKPKLIKGQLMLLLINLTSILLGMNVTLAHFIYDGLQLLRHQRNMIGKQRLLIA